MFTSRWDAGRNSGRLPGMPDPAEAGTPAWRYPDETFNVHQSVDAGWDSSRLPGNAGTG
ncbi:MAG: hypothetical protein ACLFVO_14670 [Chloroflexaceae bacterium]